MIGRGSALTSALTIRHISCDKTAFLDVLKMFNCRWYCRKVPVCLVPLSGLLDLYIDLLKRKIFSAPRVSFHLGPCGFSPWLLPVCSTPPSSMPLSSSSLASPTWLSSRYWRKISFEETTFSGDGASSWSWCGPHRHRGLELHQRFSSVSNVNMDCEQTIKGGKWSAKCDIWGSVWKFWVWAAVKSISW